MAIQRIKTLPFIPSSLYASVYPQVLVSWPGIPGYTHLRFKDDRGQGTKDLQQPPHSQTQTSFSKIKFEEFSLHNLYLSNYFQKSF